MRLDKFEANMQCNRKSGPKTHVKETIEFYYFWPSLGSINELKKMTS
jgi:hypothetical protein